MATTPTRWVWGMLLDAGILALGLWQLSQWERLSSFGRGWGIVLVVMGGGFLTFRLLFRKAPVGDQDQAARELLEMTRKLYSGEHSYRQVAPAEFEGYDIAYYNRSRTQLQELGFRYLGDVEDVTAREASSNMQAIIRVMLSSDGAVMAGVYHARVFSWWRIIQWLGVIPRDLRMCDLETELSNGAFVNTSNSLGADTSTPVPGADRHQYPRPTPLDELLRLHQGHVQAALAADPGADIVHPRTLKEVLDAQNRLQALKNAHRQTFGYIDAEEIAATDGGQLSASGRKLVDTIERIKQEDADTARQKQ